MVSGVFQVNQSSITVVTVLTNRSITNSLFCRQVERDCEFLEQEKIMDYSLLVGVHFRQVSNSRDCLVPEPCTPQSQTPTGSISCSCSYSCHWIWDRVCRFIELFVFREWERECGFRCCRILQLEHRDGSTSFGPCKVNHSGPLYMQKWDFVRPKLTS